MSDYRKELTLPGVIRGDQWKGITSIGPITIAGGQPSVTLARVRMQFRLGNAVLTLDSDSGQSPDAPISIVNPTTWVISIPAIANGFSEVGKWLYDIEFYGTGEGPTTYIKGSIYVYDDVTK